MKTLIRTWIMVHQEPSGFSNFVSPQIPMILESSATDATRRFTESGVTVYNGTLSVSHGSKQDKMQHKTYSVRIDSKDILIKGWIYPNDIPHLVVNLELQRRHRAVEVDLVEVRHEKDLTVTFSAVTRLLTFARLADFNDHHVSIQYQDQYDRIGERRAKRNAYGTTWPSNSYKPE